MGSNQTFFESLSLIGWIGILLWVGFFVAVFTKKEWFVNYDYRFPKLKYFDELFYEEWHEWLFMIVRFILMVVVLFLVTKIMFAL